MNSFKKKIMATLLAASLVVGMAVPVMAAVGGNTSHSETLTYGAAGTATFALTGLTDVSTSPTVENFNVETATGVTLNSANASSVVVDASGNANLLLDVPATAPAGTHNMTVDVGTDTGIALTLTVAGATAPTVTVAGSPFSITNAGQTIAITGDVSGIIAGARAVTWTISETGDTGNILTIPSSTTGTLSDNASFAFGNFVVAANSADESAKTATAKIAFTGGEDYANLPADITLTFNLAAGAVTPTITEITGAQAITITAPVTGETPQSTIAAGTGYTGAITWTGTMDANNKFAADIAYTANVVLTATASTHKFAAGATMTCAGSASVTGNTISADSAGNTLTSTITFAKTAATTPTALTFTDDASYDIPTSTVGTPITQIDVSAGVTGGTSPYAFTATNLPGGITIATDGKINGTPTTAGAAGTATITVTDNAGATANITIGYGIISAAPTTLGTVTVSLTAGNGKVILAPQTVDAGFEFYYKKTATDDTNNKPTLDDTTLTNWTAYTAATDIPGTNGTAIYVQVIKVNTADSKIKAWGQASATPTVPAPPTPPTPPTTNYPSYSGGGSSTPTSTPSTDLSTIISNSAVSANTPKGTEVEVPSSISDPTFDTREVAVNAPEAKAFVNTAANAGFAFAKVFQMNLFDGTTKVTKVEDGRVKIALPFAGKTGYEYIVLRYEANGGITAMPALYKDGQITFTTDHFSLYAIAVKSSNKNLFADTTVKPTTGTSVPQTAVCGLTKLF